MDYFVIWIGSRISLFISLYLLAKMASRYLAGGVTDATVLSLIIAATAVFGISGLVLEIKNAHHPNSSDDQQSRKSTDVADEQ
ncbi:MAG: hypothetical protein JW888_09885 [Pirellulales bacterium]|nr:hypothetical protein [Pirellulales bacterium]